MTIAVKVQSVGTYMDVLWVVSANGRLRLSTWHCLKERESSTIILCYWKIILLYHGISRYNCTKVVACIHKCINDNVINVKLS